MVRALHGTNSSANVVVHMHIMGSEPLAEGLLSDGVSVSVLSMLGVIVILLGIITLMAAQIRNQTQLEVELVPPPTR